VVVTTLEEEGMLLCLEVRRIAPAVPSPGLGEQTYRFRFSREEVLIGRSEATDVLLPHEAVSLVHARLLLEKGRWMLMDMGSTNGTTMDGERLVAGEPCVLYPGALLKVGPFAIEVLAPDADLLAPDEEVQTGQLARQMVRDLMGALDKSNPFFEVLSGPTKGSRAAVPMEGGTIGRGADCVLSLPDKDASRHHAGVQRVGGTVEISDLDSKNGVVVEGEKIEVARALNHGEVVQVGSTRLRFVDPAQELLSELQTPHADEPAQVMPQDDEGDKGAAVAPLGGSDTQSDSVPSVVSGSVASRQEDVAPEEPPSTKANLLEKLLLFGIGGVLVLTAVAAVIVVLL